MSPSSSALPLSDTPAKAQSRHNSSQEPSFPSPISRNSSKQHLLDQQNASTNRPPHYTVFIRLPFRRENFEDPPPVEWNAAKDRQLWKLISGSHAGKGDLDWEGLSNDFNVDLGFLLMQAAWLSERHLERLRKQVGRISGGGESAIGSASAVGGLKMERTGSRESRMPGGSHTAAVRRCSPSNPAGMTIDPSSSPGTSTPLARATISRTPSSATVTQSKIAASASRQPQQLQRLRGSSGSGRQPTPTSATNSPRDEFFEDAVEHEGGSDSDSGDEPPSMARSQAFRRGPIARKAQKSKLGTLGSDGDAEDDETDSGDGFLPFAATGSGKAKEDPAATLRSAARSQTSHPAPAAKPRPVREDSNVTASSASSNSSALPERSDAESGSRPAHPLSPRHRAQLAGLSPRGSEGSPSMGSSFSDLDDASVTQSALEEALMSNMRQGGGSLAYGSTMASRMSSLRDALGRRTGAGQ